MTLDAERPNIPTMSESPIPYTFDTKPIRVWRAFIMKDHLLRPLMFPHRFVYEPEASYEAICVFSRYGAEPATSAVECWDSKLPYRSCGIRPACGFYALKTPQEVRRYIGKWDSSRLDIAIGEVLLYGRIREGERGYQATKMNVLVPAIHLRSKVDPHPRPSPLNYYEGSAGSRRIARPYKEAQDGHW